MKETMAFQITALYRNFMAYTTDELKKTGLSFGLMPYILYTGKHPGCTQAELTRALHLDWGYSQRSIAKLTGGGFLLKTGSPHKTGSCLRLTESGRLVFDLCHSVFQSWDQLQAEQLLPEERELLLTLLQKLTAGIAEGRAL